MAKEYVECGSIRKGDYGLYLKFHPCRTKSSDGSWGENSSGMKKLAKALESSEGLNLSIEKPQVEINRLLEKGFIDDAEAEKRLANIPEWKKYKVTLVIDK